MTTQTPLRFFLIAAALIMAGSLVSCSDSTEPGQHTGTLRLNLVDAPAKAAGVESLVIVFEEVRVHRSADAEGEDAGWFTVLADTLPAEDRTFDLLQLVNGVWATLGEVDLDAGAYSQIRIMLEDATLVVDGAEQELVIPSGSQSGIKLTGGFTVEPDVVTTLTLDFDVNRSLHEAPPGSGRYLLRPTIRLVQNVLSGTISGTVLPVGIDAAVFALDAASGDTVTSTLADPVTGGYVLQALLAGDYDVTAVAEGYEDATQVDVEVTAGAETPGVDFTLEPTGG